MGSECSSFPRTGDRDQCLAQLAVDPCHRGALHRLGDAQFAAGEIVEARKAYTKALDCYPDDPTSLVSLARLLIEQKEPEVARGHLEHALEVDPHCRAAHAGLSFVLAYLGDGAQARAHQRAAFQGRCVIPGQYRGEEPPIVVLKLISTSGGNLRTEGLLSDCVFQTHLVATEFYDSTTVLPPHQLILNAIGDADVAGLALDGARLLLKGTSAPLINSPSVVATTGRLAISRRLANLPGVITPRTALLSREALVSADAHRILLGHGFRFPLLLRSPGFHGGEHFFKVETAEELDTAVTELPGSDLYVIEFLNARARDGKIRKYRVMIIDGEIYPLHAAIDDHWKIHYFSADMEERSEHRAEDAAFLSDMPGVLGTGAMRALRAIQKTLGLDYGGIDFGLSDEGVVLVFEANATMAILPPGDDPRWDYRRPAVERVLRAVRRMLMDRAATAQLTASAQGISHSLPA
jgi:glutathione synthase/RimK-type ligase-like ATP-grasp enzyme